MVARWAGEAGINDKLALTEAWRVILRDLCAGRPVVEGVTWQTVFMEVYPGLTLPERCPWSIHHPPEGWSLANFMNQRPPKAVYRALKKGAAAAWNETPEVRMDLDSLRPFEAIVFDDQPFEPHQFSFGTIIRPIHITLSKTCTLFGDITPCTGLSAGMDNESDYFFTLRNAREMMEASNHLSALACKVGQPRKRGADFSLNLPGFSMEYEGESVGDYDATALYFPLYLSKDGELMVGVRAPGLLPAVTITSYDECVNLAGALAQLGLALDKGEFDFSKEKPL